jgi:hypothetical protein
MPPRPAESTAARIDPESVARHVNLGWALTRDRLARRADFSAPDPILARLDRIERDLEALVALLAERAP